MELPIADVLEATGGRLTAGDARARCTSYHTDSRTVEPGGLFFALAGASLDGHAFCDAAAARGAVGVVVDHEVSVPGIALVRVRDTWRALYDLARHVLERVAPLVVGVTGSNGKTSTKEMAAAVLGVRHRVLRSRGNLNSETGVPLTLLELEPSHTAAVLEMGMQAPGEVARLAALARPRVGVVTMIGTVHLEFFRDHEALARAKGELVEALPPDGLAVLNADDARFDLLRGLSRAPVVSFGFAAGDLRADGYRPLPEGGSILGVEGVEVRLGLSGRHQARNALAALAAGRFAGVSIGEGAAALAGVRIEQRLHELRAPDGYIVVDDSYNASPESMLAAFDTVAERPRSHETVGRRAREVFDRVAVVDAGHGRLLAGAADGELLAGRDAAVKWIRAQARPGDVVLVKASHGIALDEVVRSLIEPGKPVDSDVQQSGGAT